MKNKNVNLYSQGMFFPQLFGIVGEKLVFTKDHQYDDPEDLCDDRYLLEVRKLADPLPPRGRGELLCERVGNARRLTKGVNHNVFVPLRASRTIPLFFEAYL